MEAIMKRWIAVAVMALAGASQVYAQDAVPGPGSVVVTVIPAGVTAFTEGKDTNEPSFANYGLGAAVEVYFNRFISVEGEVTGALGVDQDVEFATGTSSVKTPNLVNYNGNLVVSVPGGGSVVPYVTGGIGALSLLDKATLDINDSKTFLAGNAGGGIKWFHGRWGLRGDYRFLAVRSDDDAPAFFGRETRYGHRLYAALLINTGR
jgi:opacity protein-like surface antigen